MNSKEKVSEEIVIIKIKLLFTEIKRLDEICELCPFREDIETCLKCKILERKAKLKETLKKILTE